MEPFTADLWAKHGDSHPGDRLRLFTAVSEVIDPGRVLYPGSFVDIAPSFVWPDVTYVDSDQRARRFFDDSDGVQELIAMYGTPTRDREVVFIDGDYTEDLGLHDGSFDLLISLYAGFVSEHCTRYLRLGGTLLVNPSHGDAAMASIDARYSLRGVVLSRSGSYRITTEGLAGYLIPKKPGDITPESLHRSGRGIGYTKSPFAYLFERVR